jgi:hypothetical protein
LEEEEKKREVERKKIEEEEKKKEEERRKAEEGASRGDHARPYSVMGITICLCACHLVLSCFFAITFFFSPHQFLLMALPFLRCRVLSMSSEVNPLVHSHAVLISKYNLFSNFFFFRNLFEEPS